MPPSLDPVQFSALFGVAVVQALAAVALFSSLQFGPALKVYFSGSLVEVGDGVVVEVEVEVEVEEVEEVEVEVVEAGRYAESSQLNLRHCQRRSAVRQSLVLLALEPLAHGLSTHSPNARALAG